MQNEALNCMKCKLKSTALLAIMQLMAP